MDSSIQDLAGGDELSDGVSIHAGFPNPAVDRRWSASAGKYSGLDLNHLLMRRPSSCYVFRINGHRWSDQGVYDGDLAVVDRAADRRPESLVISWQGSDFWLCRLRELPPQTETWGVVTAVIHQFGGQS